MEDENDLPYDHPPITPIRRKYKKVVVSYYCHYYSVFVDLIQRKGCGQPQERPQGGIKPGTSSGRGK